MRLWVTNTNTHNHSFDGVFAYINAVPNHVVSSSLSFSFWKNLIPFCRWSFSRSSFYSPFVVDPLFAFVCSSYRPGNQIESRRLNQKHSSAPLSPICESVSAGESCRTTCWNPQSFLTPGPHFSLVHLVIQNEFDPQDRRSLHPSPCLLCCWGSRNQDLPI